MRVLAVIVLVLAFLFVLSYPVMLFYAYFIN